MKIFKSLFSCISIQKKTGAQQQQTKNDNVGVKEEIQSSQQVNRQYPEREDERTNARATSEVIQEGVKDISTTNVGNQKKDSSQEISNQEHYTKAKKKLDPQSRDPSNSMNSQKVKKPSIEEGGGGNGENIENKTTETISQSQSQSQSHVRGTNGQQQQSHPTDQGSLDSTKMSLNVSHSTSTAEILSSMEDQLAMIEKQSKTIRQLNLSNRIQEESKLIKAYQNIPGMTSWAVSKKWVNEYSKYLQTPAQKVPFDKPVNNQNIVLQDGKLNPEAEFETHFILVNKQVWHFLYTLYGGGPVIFIDNSPEVLSKLEFNPYRLENYSNYCYMNSCLQSIFSIGELNRYFYEKRFQEYQYCHMKKPFKFSIAYQELLEKFSRSARKSIISPSNFKQLSCQMFDPREQHDAQEYLRYVLGEIQDELSFELPEKRPSEFPDSESAWKYYFEYHTSIIDRLFCGQLISSVKCKSCSHISNTYDPFLDLSLPIDVKNLKDMNGCLENFFKKEEIDGDYKCEKCKKTSRPQKWCKLGKIPKYLVIHFKRFKMFPYKTKIKTSISYPAELDIKKYIQGTEKGNTQYKLISVVVHSGSAEYGHYVSLNKRDKDWWFCDDDNIQQCDLKDFINQEAYLLFYERNG